MPLEVTKDRRLLRALLGGALGAVMVIAGGLNAAMAADDDDDDTFDTKFMKNVLHGLGLKSTDSPSIDYHERSPLVVPPTRDLPVPETQGAASVTKDPAWPKDPDVTRRTTAKKKKVQPTAAFVPENDMRQLRPDELKTAGPPAPSPLPTQTYSETANPSLKPWELGFKGFSIDSVFFRKEETVPFTSEPPRASLTEPPAGLRTPSPTQPYGTTGKIEAAKSIGDDRHELGGDR